MKLWIAETIQFFILSVIFNWGAFRVFYEGTYYRVQSNLERAHYWFWGSLSSAPLLTESHFSFSHWLTQNVIIWLLKQITLTFALSSTYPILCSVLELKAMYVNFMQYSFLFQNFLYTLWTYILLSPCALIFFILLFYPDYCFPEN